MSLSIYMNVHVPQAITRGLRRRGVDVLTAQEDGTTELRDPELVDRASALGRILFTRDQDLLGEAAVGCARARVLPRLSLHGNWTSPTDAASRTWN